MQKVTITAKDKAGNLLGSCEELRPETMDELLEQFEEKDILKHVWASFVIERQRELRGPKVETAEVKEFKGLSKDEQARVIELIKSGALKNS